MIKRFTSLFVICLGMLFTSLSVSANKTVQIGILVPIELPAMQQIVSGFKDQLNKHYQGKIKYAVKNAQGNLNIQRSILQEFSSGQYDIIAPIGTAATEMTISSVRKTPIIGIAAANVKKEATAANNLQVTGVLDDVSSEKQMLFIHQAMPALKQITLIHSTDPRIFDKAKKIKILGKKQGIEVDNKMVSKLSELYSTTQQMNAKTQAIFILKDPLIVAGMNTLLHEAKKRHIVLIASDDGSVAKGAAFSLGVSERQIGMDSADLAIKILNGVQASEIPVTIMKKYTVFINPDAIKTQNVDLTLLKKAADADGYEIVKLKSIEPVVKE